MSVMTSTVDLSHTSPLPMPPARTTDLRPWGFWATLGWGLFAVLTGLFAAVAYVIIWMLTHGVHLPDPENAIFSNIAGIVASVAPLAVLFVAVKVRGWPLRSYFAIDTIPRRDLVLGVACLTVLIVALEALTSVLGVDDGSNFMEATYRAAKLAGVLPLMWLGVVVVAPITEELFFRGFLHRGWATSWLGVAGTIVLTSALWAALHQQYNWLGILFIFSMGLAFGWLRQRSGSTTLTIALHGLNNLLCTVLVAVKLEWLS
jgi:uncharacterized protein